MSGTRFGMATVTETSGFATMCRAFHSSSFVVNQSVRSTVNGITPAVRAFPRADTIPITMKFCFSSTRHTSSVVSFAMMPPEASNGPKLVPRLAPH